MTGCSVALLAFTGGELTLELVVAICFWWQRWLFIYTFIIHTIQTSLRLKHKKTALFRHRNHIPKTVPLKMSTPCILINDEPVLMTLWTAGVAALTTITEMIKRHWNSRVVGKQNKKLFFYSLCFVGCYYGYHYHWLLQWRVG